MHLYTKFLKIFLSLNYFKRAVTLAFSHQFRQDNKSINFLRDISKVMLSINTVIKWIPLQITIVLIVTNAAWSKTVTK